MCLFHSSLVDLLAGFLRCNAYFSFSDRLIMLACSVSCLFDVVLLRFFIFFHIFIHLSFLQGMLKMALMYVPKSLSRMVFGLSHSPSSWCFWVCSPTAWNNMFTPLWFNNWYSNSYYLRAWTNIGPDCLVLSSIC